jgi:transcriptional antiterminator RfaH
MSYWACAQLVPMRERLALHTLTLAGYVTYLPRLRLQRVSHGRRIQTTPALFPGYAFVLVELQWYAARWAPVVARIVLDGAAPARVPDDVIAEIRSRETKGLIELPSRFKRGDPVRILRGPFEGQLAIFANSKPRERIEVLLALLGSRRQVNLPRAAVEAVPASRSEP